MQNHGDIQFSVSGAPMGKERVRITRQGHAYTPERTVNYESRIALAAQQVMAGRPLIEGPVELDILAFVGIAESRPKKFRAAALAGELRPVKKPDGDNVLKAVSDALNLVVWVDDSQVVDARVRKFYSDAPRVEIRVSPIQGGIFG